MSGRSLPTFYCRDDGGSRHLRNVCKLLQDFISASGKLFIEDPLDSNKKFGACVLRDLNTQGLEENNGNIVQGYSKRSKHFQKFIFQKLLTLNPCPVCGWKENLSKF
jgi:hypothetical protein